MSVGTSIADPGRPTPSGSPLRSTHPRGAPVAALVLAALVAVLGTAALVLLDYHFGQQTHRLFKLLAAATVLATMVLWPFFGLIVLGVATPFLPWLPRLPVPGANTLNVVMITVFAVWGASHVIRRQSVLRPGRLSGWLAALVIVCALSIVRGTAWPTGYGYDTTPAILQLFRVAMGWAVYVVALSMARGPAARRRLAWAMLLGLLLEAGATLWLGRNGRGERAEGSLGQSNDLGAFLAMFVPLAVAVMLGVRGAFTRALAGLAALAGTAAIVLSVSRAAVVAVVIAVGYVAWRSSRLLVMVMAVALLLAPFWAPDYLKDRLMGTRTQVEGTDTQTLEGSAQLRIDTWRAIGRVLTEHPIEGVGFGGLANVLPATGQEMGVEVKDSAHNSYLRALAEMGIAGLVVLLVILWRCWRLARDGARAARTRFDRQLAIGLGGATLALALVSIFGDRFFNVVVTGNFWLLCAVVNDLVLEQRALPAVLPVPVAVVEPVPAEVTS